MSILIPLSVRIVTARQDIHITRRLAGLRFRTVAPGGFASATLTLHAPLDVDPDEIAPFARVYIYDARNGAVVWEGRLEDPGRTAESNGPLFDAAALGPSTHTRDRTLPVVYVDTQVSAFFTAQGSGRAYGVGTRESVNAGAGVDGSLSISVAQGNVVSINSLGMAVYEAIYRAGQGVARAAFNWDCGFSSTNAQVRLLSTQDLGGLTLVDEDDVSTSAGSLVGSLGGSPAITADHNRILLSLRRSGATATVGDDAYWAEFYDMAILGTRFNADGTAKTTGYTLNTVSASDVVADLLGRALPEYDGAGASIASTSYAIENLAYVDGATPEQMLSDLMGFETGHLWEVFESNAAGKHRFVWRAWPSSVRYEADLTDGYSSTGSAADLFNAAAVRWRDTLGNVMIERRTQTVGVLDAAGKSREGFIDLGGDAATLADAQRAGDQFLADHLHAPNAGRLTIGRAILDFDGGRMVMPWEIKPGYLIRVRGLSPRPDVLNLTARDGATTFKIASMEYDTSSAAATLELDTTVRYGPARFGIQPPVGVSPSRPGRPR